MKYMLLIAADPGTGPSDQAEGELLKKEYTAFTEQIIGSKEYVAGDVLEGAETATSVRVRDGRTAITDGPFAETTEQLGGFYIVDVPHLDRATTPPPSAQGGEKLLRARLARSFAAAGTQKRFCIRAIRGWRTRST